MSTLQNFGVPLGSGSGRGGILQPKIRFKFRVRVFNFGPVSGGLELTQQVVSVNRPTVQAEGVAVHSYASVGYYAGKPTWSPVELTVRDDITNAVMALITHQEQKQMNHIEQTTFAAGANYKFTMLIETLDGSNDTVLETWTLEGCFLENINWGEFNYSESEAMTITMSIRYDNATVDTMIDNPQMTAGITIG